MEGVTVKMEPKDIKIEPGDIKTEPGIESGSPTKKKAPGRPKKLKQEKITDHVTVVKKKRDRFKGMSEEEVAARLLPDHLAPNLDIVIIGINPGLFAAFIGHHYAGPGNHFWKCMYLSGLIPEPMNAMQDFKLLDYGIGFTNIVARTTKGSADLSKKEIKEGAAILTEKLLNYKPKIAVFNGKGIYEVFVGHKNFYFGKQPEPLPGTDIAVFVMPSSSARCSQLPRAVDKVPFYEALKKFRDHLNGKLPDLVDSEICFPDLELKTAKKEPKTEGYDEELNAREVQAQINQVADHFLSQFTQGNYQVIPHSSAADFPNLPNMNGLSVPHIKQEPRDEFESLSQGSDSLPQVSDKSKPTKMTKKKSRSSLGKNSLTPSNSSNSLSSLQDSQNSVSSASSLPLNSVTNDSQSMTQSIPQIKQELPGTNEQNMLTQFLQYPQNSVSLPGSLPLTQATSDSQSVIQSIPQVEQELAGTNQQNRTTQSSTEKSIQSPSQSYGNVQIKQEPQDNDFPPMPPLQQFTKIKQEPVESGGVSCTGSQSHDFSYSQYLNPDQSNPLSQNGNNFSSQSNNFLQGLFGMVNKVANHEQSNYGMVNLTNQTSTGTQPLQFNDALCGIVRDGSNDMEEYNGPVIKTEPDIDKKTKPKTTRKRKSNSKPVSTITSTEDNERSLDSSPKISLQNTHPSTASVTVPQQNSHTSATHHGHSNTTESYPQLQQNVPHSQNQTSNNMYSHHYYPPYPNPVTDYQHLANGNHLHPAYQFSQSMPSFSQMMAQDLDSFRMYPYGKDFPQQHYPVHGMNSGFPGAGYPYSGHEMWGQPTNLSKENGQSLSSAAVSAAEHSTNSRRLSADAVYSQASNDTAVDLRYASDRPGLDLKSDQQQGSQGQGRSVEGFEQGAGGKKEKLD